SAKYVLVGAGTASFHAMEAIRELEPDADILIIGDEPHDPYQRPPLSKELWFNAIEGAEASRAFDDWEGNRRSIFYLPQESYELIRANAIDKSVWPSPNSKIRLITGVKVSRLDVEGHFIHLENGKKIRYSKVLLATGGHPKTIPAVANLPPEAAKRVLTFRKLEDFEKLANISKQTGQTIAIIGGGFIGSELSIALAGGNKIVQIFPEDGNMAMVFPRYLRRWTTSRLRKEGVDVRPKAEISKIDTSKNGTRLSITLKDNAVVNADYIVLAVGISPNDSIAQPSALEIDSVRGGILANTELEARTDVWVAGDVSSFHDRVLGRRRVEHYDHAVYSGRRAGRNMVGERKPYMHQAMYWSDLGPEISFEAIGRTDSTLPTVGVWARGS
ncbi:hypothetical protein BDK51DRAFT_14531, partial [Blyttiomyces helicus]